MAICRFNDAPPHSLLRPACLASLALVGLLGACASGTAGDTGRKDAAPEGTGGSGGSGGKGGSGGAGGKGGATGGNGGGGSSGVCDPIANTGCGSGEKCAALLRNGVMGLACAAQGDKQEGDTCSQTVTADGQTGDDCGPGLACFKVQGESATSCRHFCPLAGSTCGCSSNQLCSLVVPGLTGYAFCRAIATCQPLDQTGCGDGEGCYFSTSACYTGPLCAKAGSKKPGESCAASNECEKGSTCLVLGSGGTCTAFCSTESGGTPGCSGTDQCAALGGPDTKVGSCRSS